MTQSKPINTTNTVKGNRCSCKVGPGKFEGEPALTFMAWEQAILGNSDITTTDQYERSVNWLRSPLNLDADASVVKAALDYGYCAACIEAAGDDIAGGVAVWEDSIGFVYCRMFDTREEFDKALTKAEASQADDESEG